RRVGRARLSAIAAEPALPSRWPRAHYLVSIGTVHDEQPTRPLSILDSAWSRAMSGIASSADLTRHLGQVCFAPEPAPRWWAASTSWRARSLHCGISTRSMTAVGHVWTAPD